MAPEVVPVAFFSYCREDSEFALQLAADLKVAGAHVWIDQLDIEPGTPWDRAVEDALTHSPHMLVVLSPVSVKSDNVRDEVSFALSRQKRVIPVLYRDCEVPFRLARLQHIDFRVEYERALTILLRALGVGQVPHSPVSSGVAVAAAAESVVSPAEAEEQTRQQKLDEERRMAAEQTQLEEARKYAAEQARLQKAQEAAAQVVHEAERQRAETEAQARQEQSRREQRAAEQARLQEETRLAAERVRLAQEESERREAEIKARQEQLRREEQESVEREGFVLEDEPQVASPQIELPTVVPEGRVAPRKQAPTTGLNLTSPKYLVIGGALVFVLGFIILLLLVLPRRGGTEKASESKAAEKTDAQQAQPQASLEKAPADAPSPATPADASQQDQSKEKAKATACDKDSPKAKESARAADELSNFAINSTQPNAGRATSNSNPANTAATPNRVHVARSKSEGLLTRKVKPVYPPLARSARVQGQVALDVVIGKDGSVKNITAQSGHPLLIPAAIDAVKQWRYKPYNLNGQRVEVETQVLVNFTLTN